LCFSSGIKQSSLPRRNTQPYPAIVCTFIFFADLINVSDQLFPGQQFWPFNGHFFRSPKQAIEMQFGQLYLSLHVFHGLKQTITIPVRTVFCRDRCQRGILAFAI
jgi:hypothetical protein